MKLNQFKGKNILEVKPVVYKYELRDKFVTYTPLNFVDKLMFELANAGAGIIGNYNLCSFRMNGVGTFMPTSKAKKPFTGKKNVISFEEEVRIEMEADVSLRDKIVDTLYEHHPYEEPAYEIYSFLKRTDEPQAVYIKLKKSVTIKQLVTAINPEINPETFDNKLPVTSYILCIGDFPDNINELAKLNKTKLIISITEEKIIFKKI